MFLNSCTLFTSNGNDESLTFLLKQNEYEKALSKSYADAKSGESKSDIEAQNQYIKRLMRSYEHSIITEAGKHEDKGDLANAISMVEEALVKVPSSQRLQEYLTSLKEDRAIRLTRTEHRLLLAQAKYLIEQNELFLEKNRVQGPRFFSLWQKKKAEKTLPKLAKDLLICGQEAMKRHELKLAGDCLQVSQKIEDNKEVRQALLLWRQRQDEHLKSRESRSQKQSFKKIKETQNLVITALANDNYEEARVGLEYLGRANGISPEIENIIETKNQNLLTQGNRLYRSGKIKEARDIWKYVLMLDPNNIEASAHIQRAERVLQRLQELRQ